MWGRGRQVVRAALRATGDAAKGILKIDRTGFAASLARRGIFSVPKWELVALMYVNVRTLLYIY